MWKILVIDMCVYVFFNFAWKGFFFLQNEIYVTFKNKQICQICEKYVSNYYLILLTYIFFSWCSIEDKGVNIISWNWILLYVVFFLYIFTKIGLICRWKGILNIFVMLSNFFVTFLFIFAWAMDIKWFFSSHDNKLDVWQMISCSIFFVGHI